MTTFGCAETEARIVEVIHGQLDAPTEMRVHAHLEGCAACRERAEMWRRLLPGMRAAVPATPAELTFHRMEVAILRRVRSEGATARASSGAHRSRRWLWGSLALLGATATLVLGLRAARHPEAPRTASATTVATLVSSEGSRVRSNGRAIGPNERIAAGSPLELGATGEAELSLDGGATVRLWGPARLTFEGNSRQALLRLDDGKLQAEVAHRRADETFAVVTPDLRVEVRGTRFVVGTQAGVGESWVEVQKGRVAVRFSNGRSRLVDGGQRVTSDDADADPDVAAPSGEDLGSPGSPGAEAGDSAAPLPEAVTGVAPDRRGTATCGPAVHRCQAAARKARASLRRGEPDPTLRWISSASRSPGESEASCGPPLSACQDELRYLRAEAFRSAGRIDDAVTAYEAINRAGAPAAMRQNALYAAAELERRRGHTGQALVDYERALSTTARGALHEEALVGAMETAALVDKPARARAFARHYLTEFPGGRFAPMARKLSQDGDAPPSEAVWPRSP